MTKKSRIILISLSIFLISLVNINISAWINIPIASLSGGLLLFLYCLFQKFEISKQSLELVIVITFIFFLSYLNSIIQVHILQINDYSIKHSTFIGIMIAIVLFQAFSSIMYTQKDLFIVSVKYILLIHILFLFIHFFMINFIVSDPLKFDLFSMINLFGEKEPSRFAANYLYFNIVNFRPSGLFIEPGTYACTMFALWVSYYIHNNKIGLVDYFLISSLFLTQSGFGIVLGTLTILFLLKDLVIKNLFIVLAILIIFLSSLTVLISRFDNAFTNWNEGSINQKVNLIQDLLQFGIFRQISGSGLGIIDCPSGCIINDNGIFFYIIYVLGIGLGIVLIHYIFFIYLRKSWREKIFLGMVFLTKVSITHILFWLVLASFLKEKEKPN